MSVLEVDEFLEHFGVRGMQWGVRKSPRTKAQIQSKIDKIPNSALTSGYGLRGHYANKKAKGIRKKNPDDPRLDTKKFSKLSKEEQRKHMNSITRRAVVGLTGRAFVEAAVVGTGLTILNTHPSVSRSNRDTGNAVGVFLGSAIGLTRVQEIRAVRGAHRLDRLREELNSAEN